jgi:hypothetical protein
VKRYLTRAIVSVDKAAKTKIDHEAIDGHMPAMTWNSRSMPVGAGRLAPGSEIRGGSRRR